MQKLLTHTPIFILIFVCSVYEFFHVPYNTHWSVFYFAGQYIGILLWIIREALADKENHLYFLGVAVGMGLRLILELSKWGMIYDEYMESVTDFERSVAIACWTLIVIYISFIKKWKYFKQ